MGASRATYCDTPSSVIACMCYLLTKQTGTAVVCPVGGVSAVFANILSQTFHNLNSILSLVFFGSHSPVWWLAIISFDVCIASCLVYLRR